MIDEDRALVADFLSTRNETSFLKIYRKHSNNLYLIAMRLCKYDKVGADDIIQEVWVIAIRSLEKFRWESSLRTWLVGITINCSRDYNRKNKTALNLELVKDSQEYNLDNSERKIDIKNALNKLPDGYREILVLHDFEGYKHNEIGELLGISEGTSKSQLFNARKFIKEFLN